MRLSHTRLYRIWYSMKSRCYKKSDWHFKYYGARGISVCKEWMDFSDFKKWAEQSGYVEDLTIERIDVNGNYEPNNCKWLKQAEQTKNTRRNIIIKVDGEAMCLSDILRKIGMSRTTFYRRIKNVSAEEAIKKSIRKRPVYTYRGETGSLLFFANKYKVKHSALMDRVLAKRWNIQRAIETPVRKFKYKKDAA